MVHCLIDGTTTVSISAINDCGSIACSFDIVVTDDQAPVIQCMDIATRC